MDEFSLIEQFFKSISHSRSDVILGIGDDAACCEIAPDHQLLISCDTLVADVHFCQIWDAYDIAYKAVMVNVSDIAAMGGSPCWLSLALTLPSINEPWLTRFSQGLRDTLAMFDLALIGGDITRGPLSMTLTIHGTVPRGKAVGRSQARALDKIYVSGQLGAAALAVAYLTVDGIDPVDHAILLDKLQHPTARIDLAKILQAYATSAIDISDGLSADLNHICQSSLLGACLDLNQIPIHPLVEKYQGKKALDFALGGGDDYELCFTIPPELDEMFLQDLANMGLPRCYCIGEMQQQPGLRAITNARTIEDLKACGYQHF